MKANRVSLRALGAEDLERTLQWVNDPEVTRFTGTVFPVSGSEHQFWYQELLKDHTRRMFAIMTSDGKHIGNIGVKNIDWVARNAEVLVYIGEADFRGKGYGTEAIAALSDFAFRRLNLHKLYARVFSYNERAAKSFEQCGFQGEGLLREHVFRDGRYHEVVILGLLRKEQESGS
ncbi:MAG: GNAT family protein [Candidatus Eisenbacteria bacterium]|nr:GNAT family protein [Candidatus Eisenbacteria bacterium]